MNPAQMIAIKGRLKFHTSVFGKSKKAIHHTHKKVTSFQIVVDTRLNSIFIFACIKAKIAEFIKEKTVKNETIKIEMSASDEL
jgi:hypothetical protein